MTVEELAVLAEAATPGPWAAPYYEDAPGDQGWWVHNGQQGTAEFAIAVTFAGNVNGEADAHFIAACRDAVPKLIAVAKAAAAFSNNEFLTSRGVIDLHAQLREALDAFQATDNRPSQEQQ